MSRTGQPGNGPAKGPGNGNPPKPFTKPDGDNPGFVAARMRAWRERKQMEDPTWEPPPRPLNSKEFADLAKSAAAEAMETLVSIHSNPREMALARVKAAEIILERAHGKAAQPIVHERKLEDATTEELVAELAQIMREEGFTIEGTAVDVTGESQGASGGAIEAEKFGELRPVLRDLPEDTGPNAAGAPLVADRGA